ncbi:MAG: STAS/SEC14 domain-containing protein [Ferruginibacter sp.]
MNLPTDGTKIHEHPLATLWFDSDGILHKISKNTPRNVDNVTDLYSLIRHATKGKKVCAMIEVSHETASGPEVRDVLKKEIPQTFRAVALLTNTQIGQMVATMTSVLTPVYVPTEVFKEEPKAEEWLKERIHLC